MNQTRETVESILGELTVEVDTFTHLGYEIACGEQGSMKEGIDI